MGKYLADYMLRALLFYVIKTISVETAEKGSLEKMLGDEMKTWVRTPQIKLRSKFRGAN